MSRFVVSKHARERYVQVFGLEDRPDLYREIIEHVQECKPISELEMLIIRKSKKNHYGTKDSTGIHLIDRYQLVVFVIVEVEDGKKLIVTCYRANYLSNYIDKEQHVY